MAVTSLVDILPQLTQIVKSPSWATDDKYKWAGYRKSCDHADEMAVHLSGVKPDKLLKRVRPREDGAITDYRLESYEPTTQSTAEKAVTLCNKMFNPKLYGIKPREGKSGKALYDYAMVEYPDFNSIVQYFSQLGLKRTLEDPNGYFVIEPGEIPTRMDGEQVVFDLTAQIKPEIENYRSDQVWLCDRDYLLLFCEYQEEDKLKKWEFKWVDRQVISEFYISTSNSRDYEWAEEWSYEHGFDELPAWKCGGQFDARVKGLFASFFYPAVPFWNKAINAESDLDGAFISHLHPQWWSVAEECEFTEYANGEAHRCTNGTIWINSAPKMCPQCKGSGKKAKGPYESLMVSKDKLTNPDGSSLGQPPGGYIDVPTAATQMLVERVQKLLEQGLSALNMDIVNKIGNNQSGEAKAYDRTELFDFLGKIRDLFYDKHIVNTFYFFARYMFIGVDKVTIKNTIEPTVIKPSQFDIYSTDELVEQLKVSKDANVSPAYQQAKTSEVINKEFQSYPEYLEFLNLVNMLDPLAEIDRDAVSTMVMDKSVTQKTVIIHDNIREFVRRALTENPAFGKDGYAVQVAVIEKYAEERATEIDEESTVTVDPTMAHNIPPNPPVSGAEANQ